MYVNFTWYSCVKGKCGKETDDWKLVSHNYSLKINDQKEFKAKYRCKAENIAGSDVSQIMEVYKINEIGELKASSDEPLTIGVNKNTSLRESKAGRDESPTTDYFSNKTTSPKKPKPGNNEPPTIGVNKSTSLRESKAGLDESQKIDAYKTTSLKESNAILLSVVLPIAIITLFILVAICFVLYKRKKIYGGFYLFSYPPLPDYMERLDVNGNIQEQLKRIPFIPEWEFPRERICFSKYLLCHKSKEYWP